MNCSRFLGLPDVARAVVPESPPILEIEFDMNKGRSFLYRQIFNLGRHFDDDSIKILLAARIAWEAHLNYLELMANLRIAHTDAIGLLEDSLKGQKISRIENKNDCFTIGLIGHPYMLDDETANQHLHAILKKYGVTIITPEILSASELKQGMSYMKTDSYWVAEEEVVGAGGCFISTGIDGIIGIMAFGCGPDSLMMHMVERKARSQNIPYMILTVDEHTAETGIITRVEAFLDMIERRAVRSGKNAYHLSSYR